MQYLKQLVNTINVAIEAGLNDQRFQGADYNGIAVGAVQQDEEGGASAYAPLVTDSYDSNKWVGIDDTFPLRIYHKTKNIAYSEAPGKNYGDSQNVRKETANMSLIAWGKRQTLRLTPEELESAIIAAMPAVTVPTTNTALKIHSCSIRPVSSDLDPVVVYTAEYRTALYPLGPNELLIRINYVIESTYNKSCFNICDC